ncbi:MAG: DUF4347 domain-containing protein, partial [Pseudomonadales bacterium]
MFWKNRKKPRSPLLFEELEPRVLFSADGLGALASATDIPGAYPAAHVLEIDSDFKVGAAIEQRTHNQGSDSSVQQRLELVFVDSNTPDYELLVGDLIGQEDENRRFEIIMLDANCDGIEQITDVLGQYNGIDGVHIVSHGDAGQVQLGNTTLSEDNLSGYRSELMLWGAALGNDADILIYGCQLAATEAGQSLVNNLANLTSADVAASEDLTGHISLGGDWDLEYASGDISTAVAFSREAQQNWNGVLATFTVNITDDTIDVNPGDGLAEDASGDTSLRAAIMEANALAGADTIDFQITDALVGGAHTIDISAGGLPAIGEAVIIDGTTDLNYSGAPIIELNGASAGTTGLSITGDGV